MKIIGLAGPAGCGKDTIADYMVQRYGFAKLSFAQPIKDALITMFGWEPHLMDDRVWKETPIFGIHKSPRQLMQTLGTEWGRNCVHSELWLHLMKMRIAHMELDEGFEGILYAGIVISDVRFENEAEMIRYRKGSIVHISRDVEKVFSHPSEYGVLSKQVDTHLDNNGSVDELYHWVDELLTC